MENSVEGIGCRSFQTISSRIQRPDRTGISAKVLLILSARLWRLYTLSVHQVQWVDLGCTVTMPSDAFHVSQQRGVLVSIVQLALRICLFNPAPPEENGGRRLTIR